MGNIRSKNRVITRTDGTKYFRYGRNIKPRQGKDGSFRVNLSIDGVKTVHSLARIVYKAFHPDFDATNSNIFVFHKNDDQSKNDIDNLYASTMKDSTRKYNYNTIWSKFVPASRKPVICLTTNKEFNSLTEAGKFYNIDSGSIGRCCNGQIKFAGKIILDDGTIYKLVWRFIEE